MQDKDLTKKCFASCTAHYLLVIYYSNIPMSVGKVL